MYLHFGEEILSHVMEKPKDSELVQETYKKVYGGFIEEIVICSSNNCISNYLIMLIKLELKDAIDNGISTHDGTPRYNISTNLSSRVGNFNPWWNQEKDVDVQMRFNEAMDLVKKEFLDKVNYFSQCWWPAR